MAIKIDFEKAYDHLRWAFIVYTLEAVGIPLFLLFIILQCICTPIMQILLNGKFTEEFSIGRRIKQGCPLSPYIFVLCMYGV